jgi:hypothetical protein
MPTSPAGVLGPLHARLVTVVRGRGTEEDERVVLVANQGGEEVRRERSRLLRSPGVGGGVPLGEPDPAVSPLPFQAINASGPLPEIVGLLLQPLSRNTCTSGHCRSGPITVMLGDQ